MGWTFLIFAGLLEIGFGISLKLCEGFTKPIPTISFLLFASTSFYFLQRAIATIPIGTAYSVWTGIGAVGTTILGILIFKEQVSFGRIFFICTLIGSIVGLKLVSD
jgi:quaternary ammonium compound-resistance protein SugE